MDLLFTGYSESVESAVAIRRTGSEVFVRVPVCLTGRMSIRIGFVRRIFANRIGFDRRIGLVD
jgi:hypothetical protein